MVSLLKKLAIILMVSIPCKAQLLDLTKHAQGGGSVDTFLQGGTTVPGWGTLTSGCVAVTYTSPNFACVHVADTTHNGYLSSTDWNTFNGKQPAGSYALQSTTLTASSPLTGGGDLSTNRSFGCQAASASQAGCLSSTDWSTFNGKQAAGSYALQSTTLTANAPITGGGDLSTNRSFGCTNANTSTTGCLTSTDWNTFNNKQATISTSSAVTHQFVTEFVAPNTFNRAQPSCAYLSDAAASCNTDATNATNITSGTLPAARLPTPTTSAAGGEVAGSWWQNLRNGTISTAEGTPLTTNQIKITPVYIDHTIVVSTIGYSVTTADNTSNSYDLGAFGPGCFNGTAGVARAFHTGTVAGSSLAPSTGTKTIAITGGPITVLPGFYCFGFTSNAASPTMVLGGSVGALLMPWSFQTSGTTGGSALPSTITAPALSYATASAMHYFALAP